MKFFLLFLLVLSSALGARFRSKYFQNDDSIDVVKDFITKFEAAIGNREKLEQLIDPGFLFIGCFEELYSNHIFDYFSNLPVNSTLDFYVHSSRFINSQLDIDVEGRFVGLKKKPIKATISLLHLNRGYVLKRVAKIGDCNNG